MDKVGGEGRAGSADRQRNEEWMKSSIRGEKRPRIRRPARYIVRVCLRTATPGYYFTFGINRSHLRLINFNLFYRNFFESIRKCTRTIALCVIKRRELSIHRYRQTFEKDSSVFELVALVYIQQG